MISRHTVAAEVPLDTPIEVEEPETVYFEGFEEPPGVWVEYGEQWDDPLGQSGVIFNSGDEHTGTAVLYLGEGDGETVTITNVLHGLSVGVTYVIAVWAKNTNPLNHQATVTVGIDGLGQHSVALGSGTTYVQVAHTFTASASAHTVTLSTTTGNYSGVYLDDFTVVTGGVTVLAQGFEDGEGGVAGWTSAYGSLVQPSTQAHEGSGSVFLTLIPYYGVSEAWAGVDVIPGVLHTFEVWVRAESAATVTLAVGDDVELATGDTPLVAGQWTRATLDFTPTSSEMWLEVIGTAAIHIDDVTVTAHNVVSYDAVPLSVVDAQVTLDEGWSPYAQARLTCWTPPQALLDAIDPREGVRVNLTLTQDWGTEEAPYGSVYREPVTRTFDLALRGREVDHETGTMTLDLASDEALAQDYRLVDDEPMVLGVTDVATIVNTCLALIGAGLEP